VLNLLDTINDETVTLTDHPAGTGQTNLESENSKLTDFEWSYQVEDVAGRATFWPLLLTPFWLLIAALFWFNETVEKIVVAGIVVFAISSFFWCVLILRLKGRYSIHIVDEKVTVVSPHPTFGSHFDVRCRDLDSLIINRYSGDMTDSVEISLREKNGSRYSLTINPDAPLPEIFKQIHLRNPRFTCHFYIEGRESDRHFEIYYPELYEIVLSMEGEATSA